MTGRWEKRHVFSASDQQQKNKRGCFLCPTPFFLSVWCRECMCTRSGAVLCRVACLAKHNAKASLILSLPPPFVRFCLVFSSCFVFLFWVGEACMVQKEINSSSVLYVLPGNRSSGVLQQGATRVPYVSAC